MTSGTAELYSTVLGSLLASARKAAELDEAAELQLQKARDREIKAAEAAKKKRSQEATKIA